MNIFRKIMRFFAIFVLVCSISPASAFVGTSCTSDTQCAADEVCDLNLMTCQKNITSSECIGCTSDLDCIGGKVCNSMGCCVTSSDLDDPQCLSCLEDNYCPDGYICNSSTGCCEEGLVELCNCASVGYDGVCFGKDYSTCYNSCTRACTQSGCPNGYSCTYNSSSTSGTQYYGGSCDAAASTCTIASQTCTTHCNTKSNTAVQNSSTETESGLSCSQGCSTSCSTSCSETCSTSCSQTCSSSCSYACNVNETCPTGYNCTWDTTKTYPGTMYGIQYGTQYGTKYGTKTGTKYGTQYGTYSRSRTKYTVCNGVYTDGCYSADSTSCSGCSRTTTTYSDWSNGACGSYGACTDFGACGSYGACGNFGACGSYGSCTNFGSCGSYGSCQYSGTATCPIKTQTCKEACTSVANRETRSGTESCTRSCSISNGTCSYSGSTRTYTDTCASNYTTGGCKSAGASCSGCNSWSRTSTGTCSGGTISITCSTGFHLDTNSCVINTYTVAYNANGGSGTTAGTAHEYNKKSNLRANGFTRTDHAFVGWATSSTGNAVYSDQAEILNLTATHGATVTLYAVWQKCTACAAGTGATCVLGVKNGECSYTTSCLPGYNTITNNGKPNPSCKANTYTVAYNSNKPSNASGTISGSTADSNHTYDVAKKLTKNGYGLTGWTFAGWNLQPNGTGTSYSNEQSVSNLTTTDGGTVTLYSMWTANKFTVTFNANGATSGAANPATVQCTYDSACAAADQGTMLKTNSVLTGWNTNTGGTGTNYAAGASIKNISTAANVTLYAKWSACTACAPGTGATCSLSVSNNKCTYATSCKTGYNTIVNNGKYNPSCSANNYTVAYNANGGVGKTASSSHAYNAAKALTANGFSRTGYTFTGWATSATGNAVYSDTENVTNLTTTNGGTFTLYAVWSVNSYSCSAGSYLDGVNCVECETGHWCPGGTWVYNADIQGRNSCPANSTSAAGSDARADCSCNAGYGGDAATGECLICVPGTYKTDVANTACSICTDDHYCTGGTNGNYIQC